MKDLSDLCYKNRSKILAKELQTLKINGGKKKEKNYKLYSYTLTPYRTALNMIYTLVGE